jgi:hypothetical protein
MIQKYENYENKDRLNRVMLPEKCLDTGKYKQEDHDGPEIAHLYIGHWGGANFNPGAFFNQLGRQLEDVS